MAQTIILSKPMFGLTTATPIKQTPQADFSHIAFARGLWHMQLNQPCRCSLTDKLYLQISHGTEAKQPREPSLAKTCLMFIWMSHGTSDPTRSIRTRSKFNASGIHKPSSLWSNQWQQPFQWSLHGIRVVPKQLNTCPYQAWWTLVRIILLLH